MQSFEHNRDRIHNCTSSHALRLLESAYHYCSIIKTAGNIPLVVVPSDCVFSSTVIEQLGWSFMMWKYISGWGGDKTEFRPPTHDFLIDVFVLKSNSVFFYYSGGINNWRGFQPISEQTFSCLQSCEGMLIFFDANRVGSAYVIELESNICILNFSLRRLCHAEHP